MHPKPTLACIIQASFRSSQRCVSGWVTEAKPTLTRPRLAPPRLSLHHPDLYPLLAETTQHCVSGWVIEATPRLCGRVYSPNSELFFLELPLTFLRQCKEIELNTVCKVFDFGI